MYITAQTKGVRMEQIQGGGPGGQNVNKRATKVRVYFSIPQTNVLTDDQKRLLLCKGCAPLAGEALRQVWNRINAAGDLVLDSQQERTLEQNREDALATLNELVSAAITLPTPRANKLPKAYVAQKRQAIRHRQVVEYKQKKQSI